MSLIIGNRYVLQSEVKTYNETVPANTICTLFSEQADDLVIVRYGIDEDTKKAKIIGVPSAMLRNATTQDLNGAIFKQLLPVQFRPGQKFRVGSIRSNGVEKGDILTVHSVNLALNENQDLIVFEKNLHFGDYHRFERSFVDTYFYVYDEEVEAKLGDEIIVQDMKTAPRNYYLEGARMVIGPYENQKVVFITRQLEDNVFEVEDINGIKNALEKDKLMPISNMEVLLNLGADQTVPIAFRAGRKFNANEKVSKNFLLNKKLQYGDYVEIVEVDKINININEDLFCVKKFNDPEMFYLSFAELRNFFEPFDPEDRFIDQTEKVSVTYIDPDFERKLREAQSAEQCKDCSQSAVTIHELSINGFRFKIDGNNFSLDGKQYRKDDLNLLIQALTKLKDFV